MGERQISSQRCLIPSDGLPQGATRPGLIQRVEMDATKRNFDVKPVAAVAAREFDPIACCQQSGSTGLGDSRLR
jgi:hypothetical protein